MKTLFLLRHAKAVPAENGLRDSDRSLSNQGQEQAERVGKYLQKQNARFDLVLSSTALRARQTTEIVLTAAGCVTEVCYEQRIYEASRQQLLEVVSEIEMDKTKVLLVGHNPGMEELLQSLTGRSEGMAPGSLAEINLNAPEWSGAADQKGNLDGLVKP